jgi:hypothetical protein
MLVQETVSIRLNRLDQLRGIDDVFIYSWITLRCLQILSGP